MGTFVNLLRSFIQRPIKRSLVVALAFVIVGIYALIALNIDVLNPLAEMMENFSMSDKYYQMLDEEHSPNITIVDLTKLTSRADIAKALEEIESCHPKVIGMDCVFSGLKEDTAGDDALREVAMKYDNIVFSYRLFDERDSEIGYSVSDHSFFAYEFPVREGVTEMPNTSLYYRLKKTMQLGWTVNGETEPSMVAQVANIYADSIIADPESEPMNINFSPTLFDKISPDSILSHKDELYGRIVYFGTLHEQVDMHYTPLGKMAGVELLAYATQTLVDSREIKAPPMWLSWIISFLLVYVIDFLKQVYLSWTSRSKHPLVRYLLGTQYLVGLLTFAFIALFIYFTFLLFELYKVDISVKWALAAIAFLSTSRSLCQGFRESIEIWINNRNKKNNITESNQ